MLLILYQSNRLGLVIIEYNDTELVSPERAETQHDIVLENILYASKRCRFGYSIKYFLTMTDWWVKITRKWSLAILFGC